MSVDRIDSLTFLISVIYIVSGVNYGKVDLNSAKIGYPVELQKAGTEYTKEVPSEYVHQEEVRKEAKERYSEFFE